MRAFLKAAALAAVAFLVLSPAVAPVATFAQAVVASASSTPDTTVSVPVGNWLQGSMTVVVDILGLVVGALVTFALSFVPAAFRTYITAGMIAQVDQLLGRGLQFGLQKVVDAIGPDRTLTVDVKSEAVAHAVQYVLDHGPQKLIAKMGGAEGIEEKIIARLPLPKGVAPAPAEAPTTTAAAAG